MATVVTCKPLPVAGYRRRAYGTQHAVRRKWFVVLSEGAFDGADIASAAVDPTTGAYVLQPGEVDSYTNFYVTSVGADPEGDQSGINWTAWADETSDPFAGSNPIPWLRKDKLENMGKEYDVPMVFDFNDNSSINGGSPQHIVTSALRQFDPPLTQKLGNALWRIERARRAIDIDREAASACKYSFNQNSFTLYGIADTIVVPAESAYLHDIVFKDNIWTDTAPGTPYYDMCLTIEVYTAYPPAITARVGYGSGVGSVTIGPSASPPGFKYTVLMDFDTYTLDPTNHKPMLGMTYLYDPNSSDSQKRFLDPSSGLPVLVPETNPFPLNSDGSKLVLTGTPATDIAAVKACVRAFQRGPVKDWSSFIL